IGIAKVHASSPATMIDIHILQGIRLAAVGNAFGLDAPKDRIEVLLAHLERVMVNLGLVTAGEIAAPILMIGEIHRQRTVDLHRREVVDRVFVETQAKYLREEPSRRDLVTRWHDRM